jgi:hypothetical protein
MSLARLLAPLGYKDDPEITKQYGCPMRQNLLIRTHGMGHCQVVGQNPKLSEDRKYFLGVLGGSNWYDVQANEAEFRTIGNPGTHYFTIDELCRAALETQTGNIYTFSSVPQ